MSAPEQERSFQLTLSERELMDLLLALGYLRMLDTSSEHFERSKKLLVELSKQRESIIRTRERRSAHDLRVQ